jgi:hypothetical protein
MILFILVLCESDVVEISCCQVSFSKNFVLYDGQIHRSKLINSVKYWLNRTTLINFFFFFAFGKTHEN